MRALESFVAPVSLVAAVLVLGGCGGSKNEPVLNPVHGTVTLDGAPLPKARVTFSPEKGPSSAAITDDAGKYELMHRSGEKGAVEGKHAVEISTDLEGAHTKDAERIPSKFNTQTTLSATVKKGDNSQDFPLTSK